SARRNRLGKYFSLKLALVNFVIIRASGSPQAFRKPVGSRSVSGAFYMLVLYRISIISPVSTSLLNVNLCWLKSSLNIRFVISPRSVGGTGKKRSERSATFSLWDVAVGRVSSSRPSGGIVTSSGLVWLRRPLRVLDSLPLRSCLRSKRVNR